MIGTCSCTLLTVSLGMPLVMCTNLDVDRLQYIAKSPTILHFVVIVDLITITNNDHNPYPSRSTFATNYFPPLFTKPRLPVASSAGDCSLPRVIPANRTAVSTLWISFGTLYTDLLRKACFSPATTRKSNLTLYRIIHFLSLSSIPMHKSLAKWPVWWREHWVLTRIFSAATA